MADVSATMYDVDDREERYGIIEVMCVSYRRSVVVVLVAMDGKNFTGTAVHPVREVAIASARANAFTNMRRLYERWGLIQGAAE